MDVPYLQHTPQRACYSAMSAVARRRHAISAIVPAYIADMPMLSLTIASSSHRTGEGD